MSPSDQNIAVAEKLGITVVKLPFVPLDVDAFAPNTCFTPEAAQQWRRTYPHSAIIDTVPDYVSDTNTRPQMLASLTDKEWLYLLDLISDKTSDGGINAANGWEIVDRTAKFCLELTQPQFTELFLRVTGGWKE